MGRTMILKKLIVKVMMHAREIGLSNGMITYQSCFQREAPSISAASSTSSGWRKAGQHKEQRETRGSPCIDKGEGGQGLRRADQRI